MTTKTTKKTEAEAEEKNLPATVQDTGGLPAELMDEALADAGKGSSTSMADRVVPYISVLQDMTPMVKPRDPKYVEGAQAGMFLLNGVNRLIDGEEGFIFQPCYFDKLWVEWVPRVRGGGFVAHHKEKPEDAKLIAIKDERGNDRQVWRNSRDNDLIETRYHFGHIVAAGGHATPAIIALSSTGHTSSRQWMELMNEYKVNGKPVPTWFRTYRVTTTERRNPSGSWFVPKFEHDGWVQDASLRAAGKQLYEALDRGEMRAAEPESEMSGGGDSDTPI